MLVYDITNEKSFDNIKNWIRNIEEVGVPGRERDVGGFCRVPCRQDTEGLCSGGEK